MGRKTLINTNIRQKGLHFLILILFCAGIVFIKSNGLDRYFLFESGEKILKLLILSYLLLQVFSINSILNYKSTILFFLGQISYELYLINFPFILRYNPIKPSFLLGDTVVMFYLLLVFLIVLSIVLKMLARKIRLRINLVSQSVEN